MQVAVHALQFLNKLVTLSIKALGSSALLGVVSAAAKYAAHGGPPGGFPSQDARLQAAYFLQFLAGTNLLTAQLLLTCQVPSPPPLLPPLLMHSISVHVVPVSLQAAHAMWKRYWLLELSACPLAVSPSQEQQWRCKEYYMASDPHAHAHQ